MIIFIFCLSQPFPSYLGWNEAVMVFFNFLNIFAIFMEFSFTLREGTKRSDNFLFSRFLRIFQPILAWNEAIMVIFNFLNFFAIFFEFSLARREGTKRSNNFYFLSFSALSNLFCHEMKP